MNKFKNKFFLTLVFIGGLGFISKNIDAKVTDTTPIVYDKGDSDVGYFFSQCIKEDPFFGTCKIVDSESELGNGKYKENRVIKFDRILDAAVSKDDIKSVPQNVKTELGYEIHETISKSYTSCLSTTLEASTSVEANSGIDLKVIKSGMKTVSSLTTSLTSQYTSTAMKSKTKSFHATYEIERDYDSHWQYQYRASFNVYKICTYDILNQTKSVAYSFVYIEDTLSQGLYEVFQDSDGKYYISANTNNDITVLR